MTHAELADFLERRSRAFMPGSPTETGMLDAARRLRVLAAVAAYDGEFHVSCPWGCAGDARGIGHADDCPWQLARQGNG